MRRDLPAFIKARGKLLLWLALAGLLVAGLIGWELQQSHSDARAASQLAAQNLSMLLKEQLDGAFRETDLVLRDLAGKVEPAMLGNMVHMPAADRQTLHALLDEKLSTLSQVDTMTFLSPDSQLSITAERITTADTNQYALWRQLRGNPGQELVFSKPVTLPGSRDLGFVVARRIPRDDGSLAGVVTATVTLEYFNQLARRLEAPEHSAFALLDTNLTLVARYPEVDQAIGKPVAQAELFDRWVNGRSNGYMVWLSAYDGVERGVSFRRLENFPFIVLVGLPENNYLNDWRLKAAAYAAAYLMLLLFGVAMAWRGWREAQLALAVQLSANRMAERDAHILRALETISRPLLLVRARDDVIVRANQAAEQLCGKTPATLVGLHLPSLYLRPEHHADIVAQLAERQVVSNYELKFRHRDGSHFWAELSGSLIEYEDQPAYFLSLQDISERKAAQETLWYKATVDPLTGIANRGYFMERAEQEWFRARRYDHRLCLLLLDIDHFKLVNDSYGHDAGDQVLRAFTDRLQTQLRETDVFGRIGGEEFAVLLLENDDALLREVAERLRNSLAATPILLADGSPLFVTVSIGSSHCRPEEMTLEVLLKQADQALYIAKRAGRNQVVYFDPVSAEDHDDLNH
ncbi:sensor domain-containing diguanylate cyclase [Chitinimonas naiadis]